MTPLQRIAMGLVLITFRAPFFATEVDGPLGPVLVGYDGLAAPVGWALVLWGVAALPSGLSRFRLLLGLTGLAAALSVPLWLPVIATQVLGSPELAWAASVPQWLALALLCQCLIDAPRETPEEVADLPAHRRWPDFGLRTTGAAFLFLVLAPPIIFGGGVDALIPPTGAVQLLAPLYLIWTLFRLHRFVPAASGQPDSTRSGP